MTTGACAVACPAGDFLVGGMFIVADACLVYVVVGILAGYTVVDIGIWFSKPIQR
jgi:hypothetical protein